MDESVNRRWKHQDTINSDYKRSLERSICRTSPAYWVNHYALTFDPRGKQSVIPFDLFPKQEEFLAWLQEREKNQEDGLVEKSRDMGVTWLCAAYAVHGWLFRPGFRCGFGSRKLELVDRKGDMDSIFEKIRFLVRYLPRWMLPAGFSMEQHGNLARLINPENGSSITGEGGDQIGRGGRASLFFVDEAAFLEHPDLIDRALSQTTRVKIDVSTPNGPGNPFAQKRQGGRIPVFSLRWTDDPRKGPDWYAYQKNVRYAHDPVGLAQEVDIDYTASIEGICIPARWVRAAVNLQEWAKEHRGVDFPEDEDLVAGMDVADEGKNKNVLAWRRGPVVLGIQSWAQCNTSDAAFLVRDLAAKLGIKTVNYDANAVGVGVRNTWKATGGLTFAANGVMAGAGATEKRWPDGKTSKEKFLNLRAEMWWGLRVRFEKAYEFREQGRLHPPAEMISIPDEPTLVAQLSMPLKTYSNTGKLQIEGKREMAKRGIQSPDHADALALCFSPSAKHKLTARMFGFPGT